ncbi:MAG: hypothetical protein HW391_2024, partial [Chloroflexi bacterium]|nr:hypothetical protein [Chloroflexota bacterium]
AAPGNPGLRPPPEHCAGSRPGTAAATAEIRRSSRSRRGRRAWPGRAMCPVRVPGWVLPPPEPGECSPGERWPRSRGSSDGPCPAQTLGHTRGTRVRLTGWGIARHAALVNQIRRDGRRSEHRPSSSNRIDSLPRLPPGSPIVRHRTISLCRASNASPRRARLARRRHKGIHAHHAHEITSHVHDRTGLCRAPAASPAGRPGPALLLHQRLRQLPGDRRRSPRGGLPGLRLPPPPQLVLARRGRRGRRNGRAIDGPIPDDRATNPHHR